MKKFIIFIIIVAIVIGFLVSKGYIAIDDLTNQIKSYVDILDQIKQDKQAILDQLTLAQTTITNLYNEITNYKTQINALISDLQTTQQQVQNQFDIINSYESKTFTYNYIITDSEIDLIAQTVYGEARGLSQYEQSLVIWCILNRVDNGTWGSTITQVIAMKDQFHGYNVSNPITKEIRTLVEDVVIRWQLEKQYGRDFGRTLPDNYLYFHSSKGHNEFYYFTNGESRNYYNWSGKSNPYQ